MAKWFKNKWHNEHKPETIVAIVLILCVIAYYVFSSVAVITYGPTNAHIVDSVRHYPPVIRGGSVYVECQIVNSGDSSLVITDIQPANLSIEQISPNPKMVAKGDTAVVAFVFSTDKVVGYTKQKIRFYGNIAKTGMLELTFDTHVVRRAGDLSDYEDIYFDGKQDYTNIIVDGELGEKGYWTDSVINE